MAKIGGASTIGNRPKNVQLQREAAGGLRNGSPFISVNTDSTKISFQTLNGIVASDPIDFDPKKATNSISDNVTIDPDSKGVYKVIYYISSDKSREIKPVSREFLSLSKGNSQQQNQYKLGLVDLAMGVGGGRIIYDETKFSVKPQIGDYITFQAVQGDLAFPSKIIEIQQSPEVIKAPSGNDDNKNRKPEENKKPPSAPPTKSNGGSSNPPPNSSKGEKISDADKTAAIRPDILNNRENYFGKSATVSIAEYRWILEPEIRKVAQQYFKDIDIQNRWVAQTLIWSINETGFKLKSQNQYFGQPYMGGKYNEQKITISSDCKRNDRSDKCYCTTADEWNKYCDKTREKEMKKVEGKTWFYWLTERRKVSSNSKDLAERTKAKKLDEILSSLVARPSAPFHYAGWSSMLASIESHYQFHKTSVRGFKTDDEYIKNFDNGGVYNKNSLLTYKTIIKYMNLEIKNGSVVATQKTYDELKTDNEKRNYLKKAK